MPAIDERIIKFIKKHHVLTIATSGENIPWCASCFYVYLESDSLFVFTTEDTTRHGNEMLNNNNVAGAIALETSVLGKIQGIQFSGTVHKLKGESLKAAKIAYLKKFPVALPFIADMTLWAVKPDHIKMTDNRLGFGKKIFYP